MSRLADLIDTAFDLSYLDFPRFPATSIRSIGILGGGTAGYLAALALKRMHPHIRTEVIESSRIPVIGVGESTTTEIVPFLHRTLGIDPEEFFREVRPTMKLGIRFEWGPPETSHFNFNFFAGHQYESSYYENNILNANWASVLMSDRKVPVVRQETGPAVSLLGSIPFSYHIDNKSLIAFLRKILKERKIKIIDAEVSDVVVAEKNQKPWVQELKTTDGQSLEFDLYIDCSGFRSKILGQALKTEFLPFTSSLFNDKAITFDQPHDGTIDPYTTVKTMNNGWCWKIPMREENHFGYVHSSQFCDEETAHEELKNTFGEIKTFKTVNFRTGRHARAWNGNVFGLGNAYGFVEPLESTAIQTAVHSIMSLCRLMPASFEDFSSIDGLNSEIAATWDTFRWFLSMHYKFNSRLSTPYWNHCRDKAQIGDAQKILDLFHARPPLVSSNFGTNSPFTSDEALVFNSYSYDTLIFGQKLVRKPLAQPAMSREDYAKRISSYRELSARALSMHEFFKDDFYIQEGYMTQLFEEPDTWITETEA